MRLLDKSDASLAIALLAGAVVIFERPLHLLVESARTVEVRYDIDLLPGLAVLAGALAIHQFRKRDQAKQLAAVANAETARARLRSAELERLVAFSAALAAATDDPTLAQVFWRFIPAFARGHEVWMLVRQGNEWAAPGVDPNAGELLATPLAGLAARAIHGLATTDVETLGQHAARAEGLLVDHDLCFPMTIGERTLGVVGVRAGQTLADAERRAIGAAVAMLATALRNVQLLTQTRENSLRDPLTACFNRAYAVETLSNELQRAKRTGRPLSVMMFDIDRFKRANDEHGHLAGDAIIAAVAGQCSRTLRASDIKCRWGGDEFFIILPDTPLDGAEQAGGSLTRDIAGMRVPTRAGVVSPTISVGVAVAEAGEADPMMLVARADEALYRAKHAGRNRFVVAGPTAIRAVS